MKRAAVLAVALVACKTRHEPQPREPEGSASAVKKPFGELSRADFNRLAVRENLPVYWIADTNQDGAIDADEVAALLFYPTTGHWSDGHALTPDFGRAYDQLVAAAKAPPPSDPRIALVIRDLDAGRPTLVRTDFTALSEDDRAFVKHMRRVADQIDTLYANQNGAAALEGTLPPDAPSHSLFRRNRGPRCVAPATEHDPACSAIPGAPRPIVDVYPAELQASDTFCKTLEARKDATALLGPFTAVRDAGGGKLEAVPYAVAYKDDMEGIASELEAAAAAMKDPAEAPLVTYLHAAAASFRSNDWTPADEAWAKMTVDNSKWYVRVGPDEVYWDPCAHKAGFHLTFARINQGSRAWQGKLVPVQQDMEAAIAARAGAPYKARKVTFHLPDFIDIVLNAGNDREPLGATIGESLPNWGPVADQGRGRTVAMVNLFRDPDSLAARHAQAASVLDAASMKLYADTTEPGLLATILHEATHNLGPAHEYKVGGKTDTEVFGGPIASVLEELKAQTGALFLLELLRAKGIISDELARQSYVDSIVWAFGHISLGMYTGSHERKTYGNVAAIQIGFLIDHGALTWDPAAAAANGSDHGAFAIHADKLVAACDDMMKTVAGIKARGDTAAAAALFAKYVDSDAVVPHRPIAERFLRFPKASFVYAVVP
ncbi:MAG TPA: hypothetical protein VLX92_00520 [Kofleriaceae bacterium]|nr:hypothetical protein [Kofleriaceae bacterium]